MSLRFGLLLTFIAGSISGCFLFHKPTPQQQLFEALNRGEGPQATQLWLGMSQKDRMKFNRGEGISPAVPPEAAIKKLSEMDPDDMQGEVTIKPPNNSGGGLLDLPQVTQHPAAPAPSGAAPAAPEQPQP